MEACARGHSGVARILLKHHARIDVFDESGRTALHLAAANGHLQLTHLLLQHKAFVNRYAIGNFIFFDLFFFLIFEILNDLNC